MADFLRKAAEIRSVQNFMEPYSRYFSGKISPFVAALLVDTRVTPNHLTLAMIPAGFIGAALWAWGTYWGFILGGLFLIFLNILDAADGELARYTHRTSQVGDYLDQVAHYATNSAAFLGAGIGLYKLSGELWVLYAMAILEIGMLMDNALRDLFMACNLDGGMQDDETRKQRKQKMKLHAPRLFYLTLAWLFTNVAFFHVLPLVAIASLALGSHAPLLGYYFLIAIVSILRAVMRARKIAASLS